MVEKEKTPLQPAHVLLRLRQIISSSRGKNRKMALDQKSPKHQLSASFKEIMKSLEKLQLLEVTEPELDRCLLELVKSGQVLVSNKRYFLPATLAKDTADVEAFWGGKGYQL